MKITEKDLQDLSKHRTLKRLESNHKEADAIRQQINELTEKLEDIKYYILMDQLNLVRLDSEPIND